MEGALVTRSRIGAIGFLMALASCVSSPAGDPVRLPRTPPGIGFDDLRYSVALNRVLVPAGRAGDLDLIDPESLAVTSVSGFGGAASFEGGHDEGPTSTDEARGLVLVTDRTAAQLVVADPKRAMILTRVPLRASPDYVRFVASLKEIWVTEPGAEQIEIFAWSAAPEETPVSVATISVSNGPESLVIDESRGRAYSHRWQRSTVAIDLKDRRIVDEWQTGCAASRGIEVDQKRGLLLVACSEGTVSTFSLQDGHRLSTLAAGAGFDVIGYSPGLGHAYLAGSSCGCLITVGISDMGVMTLLGRHPAPSATHCAVSDDRGNAWVCDPDGGRIWRVKDTYASSVGH